MFSEDLSNNKIAACSKANDETILIAVSNIPSRDVE